MEREQIIKALECCTSGINHKGDIPCLDCPYDECNIVGGTSERQITGTCQSWLKKDAHSLIKELTEENERPAKAKYIFATVDYCSDDLAKALDENKMLTEENERLRKRNITLEQKFVILEREEVPVLTLKFVEHDDPVGKPVECGLRCKCQADTVRKMQEQIKAEIDRFDKRGGSAFINKALVFWFVDQITKEMLEDL